MRPRTLLRIVVATVALSAGAVLAPYLLDGPESEPPSAPAPKLGRNEYIYTPRRESAAFPPVRWVPAVSAAEAEGRIDDGESVLGVEVGGQSRAYPIGTIAEVRHVVLNDTLGDRPIVVSWCNRCQDGLVYSRRVRGTTLTFFVSGLTWRENLVLQDDETGTFWSQVLGRAVDGKWAGETLEAVPSVVTDWKSWREGHPGTSVARLDRAPGAVKSHRRRYADVPSEVFVLAIARGESARAWGFDRLRDHPVVNDRFDGEPVLVLFDEPTMTARLYSRRVGGRERSFREAGGALTDAETGSEWDPKTGLATGGPSKGERLGRLPATVLGRQTWLEFHPRSEVWGAAGPPAARGARRASRRADGPPFARREALSPSPLAGEGRGGGWMAPEAGRRRHRAPDR